jgi:hypothetical protein
MGVRGYRGMIARGRSILHASRNVPSRTRRIARHTSAPPGYALVEAARAYRRGEGSIPRELDLGRASPAGREAARDP